MIYKKGEVWDVKDRHGELTIKLLEDVDPNKNIFFEALILLGNKKYISFSYNAMQHELGKGSAGTKDNFRTSLCKFIKRNKEMEELTNAN